MLDIGINALPELTELTVCFHLFMLHSAPYNPIVSYFSEYDNEIVIGLKWNGQFIEFECCQARVKFIINVPVRIRSWHHVCFSVNLRNRRYYLAYDDIFLERQLPDTGTGPLRILGGGRLVIAQELDAFEGGLNVRQSIHGDIADLQIFSKALGPSYLKMYVNCELPVADVKPLLSFQNITSFVVRGSTEISEIPIEEICKEEKETLVMLPEKRIFRTARDACSRMKSVLAIPDTDVENTEMYDAVIRFDKQCVDAYGSLYWVGGYGELDTGKWYRFSDNTEITYTNFAPGYENVQDDKKCLTVGGEVFPYVWFATNCEYLTCPLCNFTDTASFTVRGLCKDTLLDRHMTIYGYKHQRPYFDGLFYTSIYWNNASMSWMLNSRIDEELHGEMKISMEDEYPVGVKTWNITGDKCKENPVEVLITACNSTEYTCNDGMCITKPQRCDMTIDCPDKSDELDCNIILIPVGYSTQLPPPKTGDEPLDIRIFIGVTSVREINILGFKVALDVILELRWIDRRLRMKNLRTNTEANKVQDPENVWQPTLQIGDGSRSLADLNPRSKTLMVEKRSDAIPDDETRVHEDEIYLGSDNTMYLYEVHTIGFTCQFQLQRYPFDKQLCSLTFRLIDVSSDFVVLTQDGLGVDFLGQKRLLEYEITSVTMEFINNTGDIELGQKVDLELRNLYGYYISNTYVPTTLLVIICYLTLYFDIDDFTDRIMVSLTSLLVLSSLFTQTSQTIPKTAYLKLIDLWFVVLIIFVFLIVLVLVIIENVRLRKNLVGSMKIFVAERPEGNGGASPYGKAASRTSSGGWRMDPSKNPVVANLWSQAVMPVFFSIFIISYAAVCYAGL
ncbi:uncharacterized protein [Palaemon carinicauda]|uniref:uncharacterized protein n=1 Tax=Palaemon carinicauda TaxID=392227 RepID=UPI0035B6A07C